MRLGLILFLQLLSDGDAVVTSNHKGLDCETII